MLKKVNVSDTRKLVDKTDYNAKIKDIEDTIPSFTNLTANAALTALKTRYQTLQGTDSVAKISDIERKHFTMPENNKFTNDILDAKIKKLVNKSDISGCINNTDLNKKIETQAIEAELKAEKGKIEKLKTYDSSIFIG